MKQKCWCRLRGGSESEVDNKPERRKAERETGRPLIGTCEQRMKSLGGWSVFYALLWPCVSTNKCIYQFECMLLSILCIQFFSCMDRGHVSIVQNVCDSYDSSPQIKEQRWRSTSGRNLLNFYICMCVCACSCARLQFVYSRENCMYQRRIHQFCSVVLLSQEN